MDTLGNGTIDVEYHVMEYFSETLGKSYRPLLFWRTYLKPITTARKPEKVITIGPTDKPMKYRWPPVPVSTLFAFWPKALMNPPN